ncbi:acyl-CoA dehydratase activase-related protein [Anaerovorax odorimutans]|uniref:acyl-CoA dehydratase activase-related protein n=1 Tax=Anaerovorax odorimutans TaxID=109327 RepID=UPI0004066090|nr:acyl-CoA dehydratase activase-related protein [Anaerovorax odorimutans]
MKITFPHIGDAHIVGSLFFNEIGIQVVSPPLNTVSGLEKGSSIAPDEICLPFKLMISNFISAYEMGADTAVMPATIGPCRLGEYGELFKSILDKHGYNFNWIIIDTPTAIGKKELLKRLNLLISERNCKMADVFIALNKTYKVIKRFESLEKRVRILSGYERSRGECKKILKECRSRLRNSKDLNDALILIKEYHHKLSKVIIDKNKKPIRILLVGEIYSMIEPFANHRIEEMLMDRGVSFEKPVTLGWWINNNITNPFYLFLFARKKNKYMPYSIGGYAKETIEEGMNSKKNKFDGVIQILPVGCMPEIVSKSVLNQISREEQIKVMTVIFDEMGGEAGYITRIEAFIDMLGFAKRGEKRGNECIA